MKKQPQQPGNVYSVLGGKVYGTFDPHFRAEAEQAASAAGLTFDQFMVRKWKQDLMTLMALAG